MLSALYSFSHLDFTTTIWGNISLFYKVEKWWSNTFNTNLSNSKTHLLSLHASFIERYLKQFIKVLTTPSKVPAATALYELKTSFTDTFHSQARMRGRDWPPCCKEAQIAYGEDHVEGRRVGLSPTKSISLPITWMSYLGLRPTGSRPAIRWRQPHEIRIKGA